MKFILTYLHNFCIQYANKLYIYCTYTKSKFHGRQSSRDSIYYKNWIVCTFEQKKSHLNENLFEQYISMWLFTDSSSTVCLYTKRENVHEDSIIQLYLPLSFVAIQQFSSWEHYGNIVIESNSWLLLSMLTDPL